jgi:CheY-like chemotaxis protein
MNSPVHLPILLVDDSADDVELVQVALKRTQLKNKIITLRDGSEALDYLYGRGAFSKRDDPVVILLDIKMPKVTGLEVLERIKSDEALKSIPVVMLTSSNQASDIDSSYRLGVNAYVVKAVDFTSLLDSLACVGRFWTAVNRPPLPKLA